MTSLTEFQKREKASKSITCIQNDFHGPMEVSLDAFEFTWNCPAIQQPDYGRVIFTYTPNKRIAETKSLKFYLQQYRYKNAYNEELAVRILYDFIYWVKPKKVSVMLVQNSRGGIANTTTVSLDFSDKAHLELWDKLKYKPKSDFRGGWAFAK